MMNRVASLLTLLFPLASLLASESVPVVHQFNSAHMGCVFTFKLASADAALVQEAAKAAFARIADLESKFSDYQSTSELSKLSATAGTGQSFPLSDDLTRILRESSRFWKWSDGTFDVTLGACTKLWRESRKSATLPESLLLTNTLAPTGFGKLLFAADGRSVSLPVKGTQLDLGGIAKGYALDEVTTLLKTKFHLDNFLLDAGGQIAAIGHPPARNAWGLAIEKLPSEPDDSPTLVLKLKDRHLATSGDLHQSVTIGGKSYAHIIDPKTGLGLTYTVQASVVAADGTTADAVATALCLLPQEAAMAKLKLLPNVEARVIRREIGQPLTLWETTGWKNYLAPPSP